MDGDDTAPEVSDDAETDLAAPAKTTAPKGRPTPKRDGAKRRPVARAPMTNAEARRWRKEVAGRKLSRAERKEVKGEQRQRMAERREKMMAGEEAYLLPRDQGPVRRYVRDLVDSRGNLLGLFMPLAVVLILVSFGAPPKIAASMSVAMMALVLIMVIDAFFVARRVNKLVDLKFPKNAESGWKLGFYAASRATQLRRMRTPRPQLKRGDEVT
jgi:Protein of unknown function (DUF3043)